MITDTNFRVLHRTVPVTHRTRVDEDGVPAVVQYCHYEGFSRLFWVYLFNGKDMYLDIETFPLLAEALRSEHSYIHREQPPNGRLKKSQLRACLSMEFLHTMYESMDAFFELHADLLPCQDSD